MRVREVVIATNPVTELSIVIMKLGINFELIDLWISKKEDNILSKGNNNSVICNLDANSIINFKVLTQSNGGIVISNDQRSINYTNLALPERVESKARFLQRDHTDVGVVTENQIQYSFYK